VAKEDRKQRWPILRTLPIHRSEGTCRTVSCVVFGSQSFLFGVRNKRRGLRRNRVFHSLIVHKVVEEFPAFFSNPLLFVAIFIRAS
jgi:hypothetical protein